MALPASFQEALSRAETERKIEQDSVLQRIGDTVQKGVPLLSGVVAGALSRSPIIGLGATFVADQLQKRFEEKRQQRRTRRFEERQRREAAKIAVREGLFQDEKEALNEIEKQRLLQEQENTKKREQDLLDQFRINEREEEVQKEKEEVVQEESDQDGPKGLALETTLAHIDNEISGIADLLLDRFADEEDRYSREQDRRELDSAKLRETISESNRQRSEELESEPVREREGDNLFGVLPLPLLIAAGVASIVGAIVALGKFPSAQELNEGADKIADEISPPLNDIQKQLTKDGEDMSILIAEFKIFQEVMRKLGQFIRDGLDRLRPGSPTRTPTRIPTTIPDRVRKLMLPPGGGVLQDRPLSNLDDLFDRFRSQGLLNFEDRGAPKRDFRFFQVTPEDRIVPQQQRPTYNAVINDIFNGIKALLFRGGIGAGIYSAPLGEGSDIVPSGDKFVDQFDTGPSGPIVPAPTASLSNPTFGADISKVSFDQSSGQNPIMITQTDASQVTQNQSINASKQYTISADSSQNGDMRSKFVA